MTDVLAWQRQTQQNQRPPPRRPDQRSSVTPAMGDLDLQRVKVYRLNEEGLWDDKGTGHVSVEVVQVRAPGPARGRVRVRRMLLGRRWARWRRVCLHPATARAAAATRDTLPPAQP